MRWLRMSNSRLLASLGIIFSWGRCSPIWSPAEGLLRSTCGLRRSSFGGLLSRLSRRWSLGITRGFTEEEQSQLAKVGWVSVMAVRAFCQWAKVRGSGFCCRPNFLRTQSCVARQISAVFLVSCEWVVFWVELWAVPSTLRWYPAHRKGSWSATKSIPWPSNPTIWPGIRFFLSCDCFTFGAEAFSNDALHDVSLIHLYYNASSK